MVRSLAHGADHRDTKIRTNVRGKAQFDVPVGDENKFPNGTESFLIQCDAEGHDLAFRNIPSNEDVSVQLVIRKGTAHWRGTVVDEQGKPIAGATVRVSTVCEGMAGNPTSYAFFGGGEDEDNDPLHLAVAADRNGHFELTRLSRTVACGQ